MTTNPPKAHNDNVASALTFGSMQVDLFVTSGLSDMLQPYFTAVHSHPLTLRILFVLGSRVAVQTTLSIAAQYLSSRLSNIADARSLGEIAARAHHGSPEQLPNYLDARCRTPASAEG